MAKNKKRRTDSSKIYRRILALVKLQWLRLLVAMLCMMLVASLTAATAYLVKPVLDEIFFNKNVRMLKLLPLAIIMLYILRDCVISFTVTFRCCPYPFSTNMRLAS